MAYEAGGAARASLADIPQRRRPKPFKLAAYVGNHTRLNSLS
jgi:hypothetical protein